MPAINFPNIPGAQTPPNTFSPSSSPDKTVNGLTYIWNGTGWRIVGKSGDGAGTKVIIRDNAPGDANQGDLWWDSGEPASLFIYYADDDSQQWVPATPVGDNWYVEGTTLVPSINGQDVKLSGNLTLSGTTKSILVDTDNADASSGGTGFQIFNKDLSNYPIQLNSDGTATFLGQVTANGSVLTRAGGTTLNVGDRLEKADTALLALKASAAAATDFNELKSAIATALADL